MAHNYTLHKDERSGCIAYQNKITGKVYVPYNHYRQHTTAKCYATRQSIFDNQTTTRFLHAIKELTPTIVAPKASRLVVLSAEDVLHMYPSDEWLHGIVGGDAENGRRQRVSKKRDLLTEDDDEDDYEKSPSFSSPLSSEVRGNVTLSEHDFKRLRQELGEEMLKYTMRDFISNHEHVWRDAYIAEHSSEWKEEYMQTLKNRVSELL